MVTVRWWDELRGSHTRGKSTVMEVQPHRDLSNSCCPSSTSRRLPQACVPHGPTLGLVLPASCCVLVLWPIPPVRGQGHLCFCVKEGSVFQLLQNVGEAEEAEPHQKGRKPGWGCEIPVITGHCLLAVSSLHPWEHCLLRNHVWTTWPKALK